MNDLDDRNNQPLCIGVDLFDINGKLIVKNNSALDFKLIRGLMEHGRMLKKSLVRFGQTSMFKDFRNIFNEEKYFTIFMPFKTNEEIAGMVKDVELTTEIVRELENIENTLPYTFRHTLLVTALIVKIALDVKSRQYDPRYAALAGLLHDLGKSRIPKPVLGKDTPLTESEFKFLKSHSLLGYLLLCYYLGSDMDGIYSAARDHHETLDGTGYPRGISSVGKYARLIAPVDIFDALISERPYRGSPFTIHQALDHLVNQANKGRLDKEIVYYLISYVRKENPPPGELTPFDKKDFITGADSHYGKTVSD